MASVEGLRLQRRFHISVWSVGSFLLYLGDIDGPEIVIKWFQNYPCLHPNKYLAWDRH